ncbi:MAG: TIM barrel protein [Anaerolineales bacterium]|nr:TIM barrel protein [Anaerolineales bacterium]
MVDLSCCIWALAGDEQTKLTEAARLGFRQIDIQPGMLADGAALALADSLGLTVRCVGLSFGLAADVALDSADEVARQAAIQQANDGLETAAQLGADAAYVVPTFDADPAALARYGASLQQLATAAAAHGIKVCIEHFPGRALPTAAATLAFIKGLGHDNLYLLLDLGHLQMSGEDPAAVIQAAGNRLGYVHLDDNDGVGDLHWALLDGVMTEASLGAALAALREVGYGGPLSLELSPRLPDVPTALTHSATTVRRLLSLAGF